MSAFIPSHEFLPGCGIQHHAGKFQSTHSPNTIGEFVFGSVRSGKYQPQPPHPRMFVESTSAVEGEIESAQSFISVGNPVESIYSKGVNVGSKWEDEYATYCLLSGITSADPAACRETQTKQVFSSIEAVLQTAGMEFNNVVRTWYYLDQLLDWYTDFNTVRNAFFEASGIYEKLIPASTGIGARNPAQSAIVISTLAIKPKGSNVKLVVVQSPMQCPAPNYKSSFSRAVEIQYPDRSALMISGTASIAPNGDSVHDGNVADQIDLTMRVVKALLESRNMSWQNTVRAIAYFTDIKDVSCFQTYCHRQGIDHLPVAFVEAAVCRSDLLFEIELDAASRIGAG